MLDLLLVYPPFYPQGPRSNHPPARVARLTVFETLPGRFPNAAGAEAIGTTADVVAAIVTYHDGTQLVTPYTLTVNGVTQPGGEAPVLP